jgi:hypothetical protein
VYPPASSFPGPGLMSSRWQYLIRDVDFGHGVSTYWRSVPPPAPSGRDLLRTPRGGWGWPLHRWLLGQEDGVGPLPGGRLLAGLEAEQQHNAT